MATAHPLIGEHTGAAAAYVGMTRGRWANTAHLVADTTEQAREQWLTVFALDAADLVPAHAARQAAVAAARYAPARPPEVALAELRTAWSEEQRYLDRLAVGEPIRDALLQVMARGLCARVLRPARAGHRVRQRGPRRSGTRPSGTRRSGPTASPGWSPTRPPRCPASTATSPRRASS